MTNFTPANSDCLQMTISNLMKMAESSPNGLKMFSKRGENTVRKGKFRTLRAISPFPTAFSEDLYCRHVKIRVCLGKG